MCGSQDQCPRPLSYDELMMLCYERLINCGTLGVKSHLKILCILQQNMHLHDHNNSMYQLLTISYLLDTHWLIHIQQLEKEALKIVVYNQKTKIIQTLTIKTMNTCTQYICSQEK